MEAEENAYDVDTVAAVGALIAAYARYGHADAKDPILGAEVVRAADEVLSRVGDDDLAAAARAVARSEPVPGCSHSSAFFILRTDSRISNSGDHEVWEWLLSDPAEIHAELDRLYEDAAWEDMVDEETGLMASDDDDRLHVEIHVPGRAPTVLDLYRAVGSDADGEYGFDQSALDLPSSGSRALAVGESLVVHGMTYRYGINLTDAFEMPYPLA